MKRTLARTGRALLLGQLAACVVGRQARPSQAEAARGVEASSLAAPPRVVAGAQMPSELAPSERSDAKWVAGYYHWDGVRYVWQPGAWQKVRRP
ncbi:MAG TPA: YXWGXW repeat-containing protein [Polyangiaceae bacterium]|jgi:hypothetical protein